MTYSSSSSPAPELLMTLSSVGGRPAEAGLAEAGRLCLPSNGEDFGRPTRRPCCASRRSPGAPAPSSSSSMPGVAMCIWGEENGREEPATLPRAATSEASVESPWCLPEADQRRAEACRFDSRELGRVDGPDAVPVLAVASEGVRVAGVSMPGFPPSACSVGGHLPQSSARDVGNSSSSLSVLPSSISMCSSWSSSLPNLWRTGAGVWNSSR